MSKADRAAADRMNRKIFTSRHWKQAARDGLTTGIVAAAATTLAAMACGAKEGGSALAPLNAVSHIAWGDEAFGARGFSARYTLTGLAINTAANVSWGVLHEVLFGDAMRDSASASSEDNRPRVTRALPGGALVAALAYITDYHIVPARLTPGFEKHLSRRALFFIYLVLALALAAGGALNETLRADAE